MDCPHCRSGILRSVTLKCRDEHGEPMRVLICGDCDYGINEHTEGECDCEKG